MSRESVKNLVDELRPQYDLSKLKGGARGKYYKRAIAGTNLVLIEPDLAKAFPDTDSVNRALRTLLDVASVAAGPARRRRSRPNKKLKRTAGKRRRLAASR
ncbi:MAG: hypothetical protein E6K63_13105 [Nitrospirae bacterium]|nr:MAG: hypothetical protein E6K63_13105 [Nitrospirota bacterium]